MTARATFLPAAVALVAGVALWAGCGEDEKPPPPAPPATPGGAPGTPAAGRAPTKPAFLTAAQCGACHKEIYEEWKASYHGQAMVDPLFLKISDGLKQEECIRCHAPVPLREAENWETPIARTDRREDAVTCLTCHQAGGQVTGPFQGLTGACRPVYDPDQRDVTKMCFACHNQHKTGEEWLTGPYAPDAPEPRLVEAKTCLDCHMPAVDRPLVPGGPVRSGRRHTWPGGHSMDQLKKAATLEVETKPTGDGDTAGVRVTTWVTNVGAGHSIPTDARHRSFDVYVRLWDAAGRLVLDPLDPLTQAKTQTTKFRLQYRNSNLADTQLPPKVRASAMPIGSDRPAWKGYVDVPGVTAGRGEAWLVYRMTPDDVLEEKSLTVPEFEPYRARVVVVVPFEFGT
jgi:hypothetical protein